MLEEWQEEEDGSGGSRERKDGIKEKERKIRMGAKRKETLLTSTGGHREVETTASFCRTQQGRA